MSASSFVQFYFSGTLFHYSHQFDELLMQRHSVHRWDCIPLSTATPNNLLILVPFFSKLVSQGRLWILSADEYHI